MHGGGSGTDIEHSFKHGIIDFTAGSLGQLCINKTQSRHVFGREREFRLRQQAIHEKSSF
jgi:hypothetical protein